jgi:hypothetical protein
MLGYSGVISGCLSHEAKATMITGTNTFKNLFMYYYNLAFISSGRNNKVNQKPEKVVY